MLRVVCSIAVAVSGALAQVTSARMQNTEIVLDSVRITRSIYSCESGRICLEAWRTLGGRQTEIQLDSIAKLAVSLGFDSFPILPPPDSTACAKKGFRSSSTPVLTLYWSNGVTKKVTDALPCSAGAPEAARRSDLRRLRRQVANSVGWLGE